MMPAPRWNGLAATVIYLAVAIFIVIGDRNAPVGFLPYLGTFLATAPFSVPLSWIGREPDFASLATTAVLVAATSALIFRAASGLTRLFTKGK